MRTKLDKESTTVTIRMNVRDKLDLDKLAESLGLTASYIMRQLLVEELFNRGIRNDLL